MIYSLLAPPFNVDEVEEIEDYLYCESIIIMLDTEYISFYDAEITILAECWKWWKTWLLMNSLNPMAV